MGSSPLLTPLSPGIAIHWDTKLQSFTAFNIVGEMNLNKESQLNLC